MLEMRSLEVGFRRYTGLLAQNEARVLGPVDLSVKRGEVLALVGASGAGKSLLAHALFGLLPANAHVRGHILFEGVFLDGRTLAQLRGRKMGLLPQSTSHLDPLVRCGRQMAWAARRAGRPCDRRFVVEVLDRFDLSPAVLAAYPHALSGGMARRVMLAIATIAEPDLVVADEPTSGLDPRNAARVLRHLRRLASEGRGVLLITHDLVAAAPMADRVAILRDGLVAAIEPASSFCGDGGQLVSRYARALWRAMPANGFALEQADA